MSHGSHISQGGSVSPYCQRQRSQQYCASQQSQAFSQSSHGHLSLLLSPLHRRCRRIAPPGIPGIFLFNSRLPGPKCRRWWQQNKASHPLHYVAFIGFLLARGGIFRPAVHSGRILCNNARPAPVWLHLTPLVLRLLAGPVLALVSCFHQFLFTAFSPKA